MSTDTIHNAIKNLLNEHGLKATRQRIIVMDYLMKSSEHPSADMVYRNVKPSVPSLSLGTVYKMLDCFTETGIVHKVITQNGIMRYDANTEEHNHIYCSNTNEIIDYEDHELIQLVEQYLNKKQIDNFRVQDVSIRINGKKINLNQKVSIT